MAKIETTNFGTLPILPYQANAPVKETLSFLTDITLTDDSTEDRIELRSKARQTFDYQIPLNAEQQADATNTILGNLRNNWAIPIWTQAQFVGNVLAGDSAVDCDVTNFDLRLASLALLYDGSGNYELLEIDTLTSSSITLLDPSVGMRNAFLVPIRLGFIQGSANRPTNGYNAVLTAKFVIDDTRSLVANVPAQYLFDDIYYDEPLMNGESLAVTYSQQQDIVDFDLGIIARRSSWQNARVGKPLRTLCFTPAEVEAYRQFLFRRKGKFRAFWYPTFESNLRCKNVGNVGNRIDFVSDSFVDYATARTHVAIQAGGVWYPRIVTAPTQTGIDSGQLTIDAPLNVDARTISRISFLGLHRLDSDSIEMTWNGGGQLEGNVAIIEIKP